MATRLYFISGSIYSTGTLPVGDQAVGVQSGNFRAAPVSQRLWNSYGTSGQTTRTSSSLAATTNQLWYIGQWVSDPLKAGSYGAGGWEVKVANAESNLAANWWVNKAALYIWRPSTGAKVGTISDTTGVSGSLGGAEPGAINSERVGFFTLTGSAVAVQTGDVLVCELWSQHRQGTATAYTLTFYYNGNSVANETAATNAVVASMPSYIQSTNDLFFSYDTTQTDTSTTADSAAGTLVNTPVTYYFRDIWAWDSNHGLLNTLGTASFSRSATGWVLGTVASGNYSSLAYASERATTTFGTTPLPSGAPSSADCFRTDNAISGTFLSSPWTIALALRSATAAYTGRMQINMRVWRSTSRSGSNATEITTAPIVIGPTVANLSTTANANIVGTWNPGQIDLNNEYLFFQMAAAITASGSGATQDALICPDPVNSIITTPILINRDRNTLNAVDTFTTPPNGKNIELPDASARAIILQDIAPTGAGDLFFMTHAGSVSAADAWYVCASEDKGATWAFYTGSTEPNRDGNNNAMGKQSSWVQDTVLNEVHGVFWDVNDTTAWYNRVVLTRDGDGHINGYTWDVQRQPSIIPLTTGSGDVHLDMKEVVDGNGVHRLMLTCFDGPAATGVTGRLLAAVTTPTAGLTPTLTTDWAKITNSASPGYDVLGAWSTTAATDTSAVANFTGIAASSCPTPHNEEHSFNQEQTSGSVNFFVGGYFYNDLPAPPGSLWRWRYTRNGSNWVVDPANSGSVYDTASASTRPLMGHVYSTARYTYIAYISPTRGGIRFDRIDPDGNVTQDIFPTVESTIDAWGYVAFSVSADDTKCWVMWTVQNSTRSNYQFIGAGYYDGTSWQLYDETYSWIRNGFLYAGTGGPVSWHRSENIPNGLAVLAYGYDTYSLSTQKYHLHTLTTVTGSAAQPVTGSGGTVYSASLSDAATTAESALGAASWATSASDSYLTNESSVGSVVWVGAATDSAAAAESASAVAIWRAGSVDSSSVVDTTQGAATYVGSGTDAVTTIDVSVTSATYVCSAADSAAALDSASALISIIYAVSASDVATGADVASALAVWASQQNADASTVSDTAPTSISIATQPTDSAAAVDSASAAVSWATSASDSASGLDSASANVGVAATSSDSAASNDSATANVSWTASSTDSAVPVDSATANVSYRSSATDSSTTTDAAVGTGASQGQSTGTDSAATSDTAPTNVLWTGSSADSVTSADSSSAVVSWAAAGTDSATAADSSSATISSAASASDAAAAADSSAATAQVAAPGSDTTVAVDFVSTILRYVAAVTDGATESATSSGIIGTGASANDAGATTDTTSTAVRYSSSTGDDSAVSDAASFTYRVGVISTDSALESAVASATVAILAQSPTDSATASDSAVGVVTWSAVVSDSVAVSDASSNRTSYATTAADAEAIADQVLASFVSPSSGQDGASESSFAGATVSYGGAGQDASSVSDSASAMYLTTVWDASNTADSIVQRISWSSILTDVINTSDSLTVSTSALPPSRPVGGATYRGRIASVASPSSSRPSTVIPGRSTGPKPPKGGAV